MKVSSSTLRRQVRLLFLDSQKVKKQVKNNQLINRTILLFVVFLSEILLVLSAGH